MFVGGGRGANGGNGEARDGGGEGVGNVRAQCQSGLF